MEKWTEAAGLHTDRFMHIIIISVMISVIISIIISVIISPVKGRESVHQSS
jgi:hypothetical protein